MIVLTRDPGEAPKLAEGAPTLQRLHGMPIDPRPYAREFSSELACRAFVAVRERDPAAADRFLRRLRVRAMLGGLLDDPELIAAAAREAGVDPDELDRWCVSADVEQALQADIEAARGPPAPAPPPHPHPRGPPPPRPPTAPSPPA